MRVPTVEDDPKPRQFQARTRIGLGGAAPQPPPHRHPNLSFSFVVCSVLLISFFSSLIYVVQVLLERQGQLSFLIMGLFPLSSVLIAALTGTPLPVATHWA